MSGPFKVFVVDDDPIVLDIMCSILEADCAVTTFTSAEDCQAALASDKPDMFLLDVGLPGMDGYAFCRQLKDDAAFSRIPVTFVSSHDTIDARVLGYDAGGEDFIVKPFEPAEVLRKLKVAQHIVRSQSSLREELEAAEYLASLVMASADETGILVQFMSKLIAWENTQEIASGLLELLQRYRLDGVVQTRMAQNIYTLSAAGVNLPLEVSVIEHVRTQGRIFEFRKRSVHNFERITLMVNNLPLDDPEYCGRLRDHLSVAAQGVDSRLKAIETDEANRRSQAGILLALESVSETIMSLHEAHQRDSAESSALMMELQETLVNSFFRLGLTEGQETFLQDMVGNFMKRMAALLERGAETQTAMQSLNERLSKLRNQ
jgi:DNA-binding response OmpR family regulator/cell division protein ZapA (FtsZ GTPase activity inhibitor)